MSKEIFTKELLIEFKKRQMTLTQISQEIYGHTQNYRNVRRAYKRHGIEPYRDGKLKPSKEQLEQLILRDGLSPYKVAELLGYGTGGWSNIYKYCRDYGINGFDFVQNADYRKRDIEPDKKSLILGTLLGDASVSYKGFYTVTHGEKQLGYLTWLKDKLGWLVTGDIHKRGSPTNTVFSKLPTYRFKTNVHPYFKDLRKSLYETGIKRVPAIITDECFTKLSLLAWYLDDGSLNKTTGVVTFATEGFIKEDVETLCDFFSANFGIKAVLERRRNARYSIRINKSETAKFFGTIGNLEVPECMRYKIHSQ